MNKYAVIVSFAFDIEAENVAQAHRVVRKARLCGIGEFGAHREVHEREFTEYRRGPVAGGIRIGKQGAAK